MKTIFSILGIFWVFFLFGCAIQTDGNKDFKLVSEGNPMATIIIAANPSPAVNLAALELQHHVELVSGVRLPVLSDGKPIKGNKIHIGKTDYSSKAGISENNFGEQEYAILFEGENHFHQDEELAWKYLGTEVVMQELEKYIAEAKGAALSPVEQMRLDGWVEGVWEYMQKGRADYLQKLASK